MRANQTLRITGKTVLLSAALLALAGCVVEPYPLVAPVAAPAPYYGCCYSYYDYPPYYGGYYGGPAYYGPAVGFSYNGGGGRGYYGSRHWR